MLTPMKRLLFAIVLLSAARTAAARGMFSETFAVTEAAAVSAVSSASAETAVSAVSSASAEAVASAVSSVSAETAASAVFSASAETFMSAVSSVSAEAASGLRAVFPETTVSAVPAAAGDFFRSGVPAAAASPASSAAVAALEPSADGRAAEILEKLAAGFRALGAYGVTFEVSSDEYTTRGRYAVEGENYYIAVGEAEVYCDGKIRYEIDNRRREVTVTEVNRASRNILDNPVQAFDFLGSEYDFSLEGESGGRATVRLVPTAENDTSAGVVTLVVDTSSMRPVSLAYDYDGERVGIRVTGIEPQSGHFRTFDRQAYGGYEFIDFR